VSARQTVPPLGVTAPRWDDECCPVVEPSTSTARAAAVALLSEIDWSIILDPSYGNDHFDMDPLVAAGLHAELAQIDWERQTRLRFPDRTASHLLAWVTARMRRHTWCVAHIDHCDDIVPFDECWAEPDDPESDDGDDHSWSGLWALHGDAEDFLRLAATLLRDGWVPECEQCDAEASHDALVALLAAERQRTSRLEQELQQARTAMEVLVPFARWADWYLENPCRFDHAGNCQAHGLDQICPVGPMRAWLATAPPPPEPAG
jgi:hypothetical protein